MAHAGGRPPFYKTVEEMEILIDDYFKSCEGHPFINDDGETLLDKYSRPIIVGQKPATVTGLCIALGLSSRQALINYEGKVEFNDAITRAKMRCQEYAEARLYDKEGANGAKFSLSNNFGWIDRQEITNIDVAALLDSPEDRRTRIAELLSKKQLDSAITVPYQISDTISHNTIVKNDGDNDTD